MRNTVKRSLALLLTIVMVMGLVVIPAGAARPMGDVAVEAVSGETPAVGAKSTKTMRELLAEAKAELSANSAKVDGVWPVDDYDAIAGTAVSATGGFFTFGESLSAGTDKNLGEAFTDLAGTEHAVNVKMTAVQVKQSGTTKKDITFTTPAAPGTLTVRAASDTGKNVWLKKSSDTGDGTKYTSSADNKGVFTFSTDANTAYTLYSDGSGINVLYLCWEYIDESASTAPAFADGGDVCTLSAVDATSVSFTLAAVPAATTEFTLYDGEDTKLKDGVTTTSTTLTFADLAATPAAGTYKVSATESGKNESSKTEVTIKAYTPYTSVTISGDETLQKKKGDEAFTLTAATAPVTGGAITWSSSVPGVADVDEDGEVTIVGVGETTIKAALTADADINDTVKVVVTMASDVVDGAHVFDVENMGLFGTGKYDNSQRVKYSDTFTVVIHQSGNTAVTATTETWSDEGHTLSPAKIMATGGQGKKNTASVEIKTTAANDVVGIWYKTNGTGRPIYIVNDSNIAVATDDYSAQGTHYCELTVPTAGTYYVGSSSNGGNIAKIAIRAAAATPATEAQDALNELIADSDLPDGVEITAEHVNVPASVNTDDLNDDDNTAANSDFLKGIVKAELEKLFPTTSFVVTVKTAAWTAAGGAGSGAQAGASVAALLDASTSLGSIAYTATVAAKDGANASATDTVDISGTVTVTAAATGSSSTYATPGNYSYVVNKANPTDEEKAEALAKAGDGVLLTGFVVEDGSGQNAHGPKGTNATIAISLDPNEKYTIEVTGCCYGSTAIGAVTPNTIEGSTGTVAENGSSPAPVKTLYNATGEVSIAYAGYLHNLKITKQDEELTLYSVSADTVENGTITINPTGKVPAGTSIAVTAAPTDANTHELGTVTPTLTDGAFAMPAADTVVTATFPAKTTPIVTIPGGKDSLQIRGTGTETFTATLANAPASGTVTWEISSSSADVTAAIVEGTGAVTITGQDKAATATVTITAKVNGTTVDTATVDVKTVANEIPTAGVDYNFYNKAMDMFQSGLVWSNGVTMHNQHGVAGTAPTATLSMPAFTGDLDGKVAKITVVTCNHGKGLAITVTGDGSTGAVVGDAEDVANGAETDAKTVITNVTGDVVLNFTGTTYVHSIKVEFENAPSAPAVEAEAATGLGVWSKLAGNIAVSSAYESNSANLEDKTGISFTTNNGVQIKVDETKLRAAYAEPAKAAVINQAGAPMRHGNTLYVAVLSEIPEAVLAVTGWQLVVKVGETRYPTNDSEYATTPSALGIDTATDGAKTYLADWYAVGTCDGSAVGVLAKAAETHETITYEYYGAGATPELLAIRTLALDVDTVLTGAEIPGTVTATDCTDGNNGTIAGLTTDMEVKGPGAEDYTPVAAAGTMSNLAKGTYLVRYAAKAATAEAQAKAAGEPKTLTIKGAMTVAVTAPSKVYDGTAIDAVTYTVTDGNANVTTTSVKYAVTANASTQPADNAYVTTVAELNLKAVADTGKEIWVKAEAEGYNAAVGHAAVTITKADAPVLNISASSTSVRADETNGATVTLSVTSSIPACVPTVECDKTLTAPSGLTGNGDGTWTAKLPNATETYVFTVKYAGTDNYNAATSKDVTVKVTKAGEAMASPIDLKVMTQTHYNEDFGTWVGGPNTDNGGLALIHGNDLAVSTSGVVTGSLKFLSGFTGFNASTPAEQQGFYLAVEIPAPEGWASSNTSVNIKTTNPSSSGAPKNETFASNLFTAPGSALTVVFYLNPTVLATEGGPTITIDWGNGADNDLWLPNTVELDLDGVTFEPTVKGAQILFVDDAASYQAAFNATMPTDHNLQLPWIAIQYDRTVAGEVAFQIKKGASVLKFNGEDETASGDFETANANAYVSFHLLNQSQTDHKDQVWLDNTVTGGEYTVTITQHGTTATATATYNKYPLTVAEVEGATVALSATAPANQNLLVAKDTEVTVTVTVTDDTKEVDTVKVNNGSAITAETNGTYKFTMPEAAANVVVTLKDKTVEYNIAKAAATNGSFTVKANNAEVTKAAAGTTITVAGTGESGYEVDQITVTKTGDTATTVTVNDGQFTMPAYDVTVTVTFKETQSQQPSGTTYKFAVGELDGASAKTVNAETEKVTYTGREYAAETELVTGITGVKAYIGSGTRTTKTADSDAKYNLATDPAEGYVYAIGGQDPKVGYMKNGTTATELKNSTDQKPVELNQVPEYGAYVKFDVTTAGSITIHHTINGNDKKQILMSKTGDTLAYVTVGGVAYDGGNDTKTGTNGMKSVTFDAAANTTYYYWITGGNMAFCGFDYTPATEVAAQKTVYVINDLADGVAVAAPRATEGDNVTVNVTVPDGKAIETLTYTAEGSSTAVDIDKTTKTFAMPAANVTLAVTFGEPSAPDTKIDLSTAATVAITGTAKVGEELAAEVTFANLTGTDITGHVDYKWTVGGTDVEGNNAATYTVVAADLGKTITVTVSAKADDEVYTGSKTSDATAAVVAKDEEPVVVDKKALTDAIAAATALKDGTTYTTRGDNLPGVKYWDATMKTALEDAIAEAQTVADNAEATADDVAAAVTALATATDTFKAGKTDGNKTLDADKLDEALTEAIEAAEAAKKDVVANDATDPKKVKKGTKYVPTAVMTALEDAIKEAQKLLDALNDEEAEDPTADAVTAAVAALQNAINDFKPETGTMSTGGGGGGSVANTGNTKNETLADGTKRTTETAKDGTVTVTDVKPDGTKVVSTTTPDGETTVKVTVPANVDTAKVKVPVADDADTGMVAVVVKPDGTEEVIRDSIVIDGEMVFEVEDDANVKITNRAKSFVDVPGHWAEAEVNFVTARDLFNGVDATHFAPDTAMTRGMMATVLFRLDGELKAGDANFSDVKDGEWYTDAVDWASDAGVINGYTDGTFAPNKAITRQELVVMVYRYAGSPAVSGKANTAKFNDADKVADWAADAMEWAIANGIINGKGNGIIDPAANATRAEVSAVLERFVKNAAK